MAVRSALVQALEAQIDGARALQCEFVLWPDEAAFDGSRGANWRSTIDPRFDGARRALASELPRCSMTLEDGAGRLHVWIPRRDLVHAALVVQRVAAQEGMQCLVCDDGEWSRRVRVGDHAALSAAIERLCSATVDWVVVEGGPADALFLQVGPRTLADTVTVELVSNKFLSASLAHSRVTLRRLALLQWRAPDGHCSDLHFSERSVRTRDDRDALVAWLWRSWDVAFASHGLETLRLRTLAP
ncbi:MAG: hypothetical protein JNK05_03220 [Myxococcales bacterium]|nr:hypothetical protein [Myxococcales bacterium]